MSLHHLIYCSTRSVSSEDSSVIEVNAPALLIEAREKNKKNNVSGLLYFNDYYFLQCLEGSRHAVNMTYNTIVADDRHSDVVLIDYCEIAKRSFSQWDMAYVSESSLTESLVKLYSGDEKFNPYDMSADSLFQLMQAFKSSLAVIEA
ncbi:Blue light- and temperature-regulated antirepressor BluF [Zhongshania aliphaticivorans]|uniref:Blue light- and temperature-regulated antirepressor BluF n=1 Tax=Zhongshania aliphaticivorans TaxID=1470434 RepID=A0A5S9N6Y8_9GAMM|nr:BLUF domain-containing protein [Zhongshania aliphaticivorans]CAA0080406.1 Blue light- and temperature-regulated antirepressor BluF [Zhongshania aliphaticivorans]CAA0085696.1 Blue light- and temperature-regulated antirepressor BluF [Zhongshania aliphaticivorans]